VFCRDCGAVIKEDAEICPSCGVRQQSPPNNAVESVLDDLTEGGNPFVAAAASVVLPGLGQIYNRELQKGILVMVASFIALASVLAFVGIILYPAVWLYAIYDAYTVADRKSPEEPEADATV
jgi:TM2 domain-containing membrane protein YozV